MTADTRTALTCPRALVLILVTIVGGSLLCGCRAMVDAVLEPEVTFDPAEAPPAPDYHDASQWAALPYRADNADVTPAGVADAQQRAAADVFFVHPTTYFSDDGWNQPIDHDKTNDRTDDGVLRNQASAFNGCCQVFVPRYRQATLYAFMTEDRADEADAALDLAYSDVVAAFDVYLAKHNNGRPIILAAHSQGAYHLTRLLAERFSGTALLHQLVAAYVIGAPVPLDYLSRSTPDIPLCASATDSGCLITWNTFETDADIERFDRRVPIFYPSGFEDLDGKTLACTNPLDWTAGGGRVDASAHVGAVRFDSDSPEIDAAYVAAGCDGEGVLRVDRPDDRKYRLGMGRKGDYHLVDYSLFYMDVRANAVERVQAFVGTP